MFAARVIFHIDMDAFYASIEQRDNPSLRGLPVIVGSPPNQRGVVCAASYEARRFGVKSAMPSVTAGRLCPNGVFVRPRMDHYRDESDRVMEIILRVFEREGLRPTVEPMSIDEAYVDATPLCIGPGPLQPERPEGPNPALRALTLARAIKKEIAGERGITATIGIAGNKLLAKLASDFQKPDGLTLVPDRDRRMFLRPLPVGALYGVGPVTAEILQEAGLCTIGELQDYSGDLRALVGSFAETLRKFAKGEDDRAVESGGAVKSISSEETFLQDTSDRRILGCVLHALTEDIAGRLKREGLAARTVQIKVRYRNFVTLTRQITVEESFLEASELYRLACFLLRRDRLVSHPLRLLGVSVSTFADGPGKQLRFW